MKKFLDIVAMFIVMIPATTVLGIFIYGICSFIFMSGLAFMVTIGLIIYIWSIIRLIQE